MKSFENLLNINYVNYKINYINLKNSKSTFKTKSMHVQVPNSNIIFEN